MKNKILGAVALLALALAVKPMGAVAQNAKPFVIPEVREWKGAEGMMTLGTTVSVVTTDGTESVAQAFAGDLDVLCGIKANVVTKAKPQAGDIVFKVVADKKKKQNTEAYTISITDKVEVSSTSATGLYWATRTLLQMLDGKDKTELPKGTIKDCPDFGVRGFMIDCGRKYIPMSYLHQLVKIMSYYKMNFLQVHLNDNGFPQFFEHDWNKTYAAFRLECDTYPGLTARDGFYTKAEFRDFQKKAMALGVEIVPEIDAPAHSLAFTHYDPELGSHKYGTDHLDITNPKSQKFIDALWKEYLEGDDPVFVGPRVDIGTDEYSNRDKEVVELFRAFTDHLIKHVESYGKQACLWGSLTHAKGDTPVQVDNVIMSLWSNDYAVPDSMLKLGYKCISIPDGLTYIVPHAGYYYDYLNHQYLYEHWTPNIVGNGKYTFPYDSKQILGGMFAVWNDHCGNGVSVKDIHHRTYPAIQTLSAKFWTGKNVTLPWAEFDEKRMTLSEAPGVNELGQLSKSAYDKTFAALNPNQTFSPDGKIEAGYDYSVEFDLEAVEEAKGTVLLQSPNAKLYIADPVNGRMAYERDGYLFTFNFAPYNGEKAKVCIEGNNKATYLYINGKLAEARDGRTFFNEGKTRIKTLETLVLPLQATGDFKSKVTNFNLRNSLRYTK